jgi:hypothetical protein
VNRDARQALHLLGTPIALSRVGVAGVGAMTDEGDSDWEDLASDGDV